MGVAEAQHAWTEQPLPSTPPWGVVEHATELLIGRAEVRWPEVRSPLEPYLGLGSPSGPSVTASSKFELLTHGPYLLRVVRELARKVGPPDSLQAAIMEAAEREIIGAETDPEVRTRRPSANEEAGRTAAAARRALSGPRRWPRGSTPRSSEAELRDARKRIRELETDPAPDSLLGTCSRAVPSSHLRYGRAS